MNIDKLPKGIAFAAGLGAVAAKLPFVARAIEFEQELERDSQVFYALGAKRADVERMREFALALAGTTIGRNGVIVRSAIELNRRRMMEGETLLPDSIRRWAARLWNEYVSDEIDLRFHALHGFTMQEAGIDGETAWRFVADAERLWSEVQV